LIGPTAELLRFGSFSKDAPLDCVAVNPLPGKASQGKSIRISRLIVLRHEESAWSLALDAAKEISNPKGYVGLDYIDDGYRFEGYEVDVTVRGSDEKPRFTLWFSFLAQGQTEGIPTEIGWNRANGRYQEFDYGNTQKFKAELTNPPHRGKAAEAREQKAGEAK
jgi:hypothetical protein